MTRVIDGSGIVKELSCGLSRNPLQSIAILRLLEVVLDSLRKDFLNWVFRMHVHWWWMIRPSPACCVAVMSESGPVSRRSLTTICISIRSSCIPGWGRDYTFAGITSVYSQSDSCRISCNAVPAGAEHDTPSGRKLNYIRRAERPVKTVRKFEPETLFSSTRKSSKPNFLRSEKKLELRQH